MYVDFPILGKVVNEAAATKESNCSQIAKHVHFFDIQFDCWNSYISTSHFKTRNTTDFGNICIRLNLY